MRLLGTEGLYSPVWDTVTALALSKSVPTDLDSLRKWLLLSSKPACHRPLSMPFDVVYADNGSRVQIWVAGVVNLCAMSSLMYVLVPFHYTSYLTLCRAPFPPGALASVLANDPSHVQFIRLVPADSAMSRRGFAAQVRALSDVVDTVFFHLYAQPPERSRQSRSLILMRCLHGYADDPIPPTSVVTFGPDGPPTAIHENVVVVGNFVRILIHLEVKVVCGIADGVPRPCVFLSFTRVERLVPARRAEAVCLPRPFSTLR